MFYAHASVGTLHVRPVLIWNRRRCKKYEVYCRRSFCISKQYKGSHSENMEMELSDQNSWNDVWKKIVSAFEEIKDTFDPKGLLNPGKIVRPFKSDDRSLMRYSQGTKQKISLLTMTGQRGTFSDAVEMCNNNGACRKLTPV